MQTLETDAKAPASLIPFVFLSLFISIFYYTITNMAGLYIVSDLGGSANISTYAMSFFILGDGIGIPLANPIADRMGTMKFLAVAFLLFTLFSLLCAISKTFFFLNVFRFGLGFSAGFFYIICRRLIVTYAPEEKLKEYSFLMILCYLLVPILGACFGAWIAYDWNWRYLFYFHIPLSIPLAYYFWSLGQEFDSPNPNKKKFDLVGYIFYTLGIGCTFSAVIIGQYIDWERSWTYLSLMTLGIPCLLSFVLWDLNHEQPLLELKLFKKPLLGYAFLNLGILFSVYFGMIMLVTLWLHIYANYTVTWIGWLLFIITIAGVFAFYLGKYILQRVDPRFVLFTGLSLLAFSCYYSTYFSVQVDFFHLAVARFFTGIGIILFALPLLQMAYSSQPDSKATTIFTLYQMVRAVFSGLGASLFVTLWEWRSAFFQERLGEQLTKTSILTSDFIQRATEDFGLTKDQAVGKLYFYLQQHATSLALNDVFGFMGYILLGLIFLLFFTFAYEKLFKNKFLN
jgi:DHA2 family multidrug resistance protein